MGNQKVKNNSVNIVNNSINDINNTMYKANNTKTETNNRVNGLFLILYITVLTVPWLFLYEIFPFYSNNITVTIEIISYIIYIIILGFTLIYLNKDIRKINNQINSAKINQSYKENLPTDKALSKKYKLLSLCYKTLRILILITFCFLILILILIGISYFL